MTTRSTNRPSMHLAFIWALSLLGGLLLAPPAGAFVTCDYGDGPKALGIYLDGFAAFAQVSLAGSTILVDDVTFAPQPIICSGNGPPTTANTDLIQVVDRTDSPAIPGTGDGEGRLRVVGPTHFAPGNTLEPGGAAYSEIEFQMGLFDVTDSVTVVGIGAEDDFWQLGAFGLDWNANPAPGDPAPDVEMTFPAANGDPTLRLEGGAGADSLSAQGGAGAGTPFVGTDQLSFNGGAGNDILEGSGAADGLVGEAGDDVLRGLAGNDSLDAGAGDDTLDAGAGDTDEVTHLDIDRAVTVDLNRSEPQDTGAGVDSLAGVENVKGTQFADTLIGDAAANRLIGGVGDDRLDGRGGPDRLEGGDGIDSVSYAQAPAGVIVDLTAGTATGGAGIDSLVDLENVVGSPFSDTLTGSAVANSITGLAGPDLISALAGIDMVDVRDGEADIVGCGSEVDSATADQQTLDVIDPDCEVVSYLPVDPGPDGGPDADTELRFELTAKPKQRVLRQRGVVVEATCPLEACTVTATAKLKGAARVVRAVAIPATVELRAGITQPIELALTKKGRRALKAALRRRKPPKLAVTATATDTGQKNTTRALTVKAKG